MKVYTHGHGNPKVTIIGSIHGDEPSGKKIIQKLNNKLNKIDNSKINGQIKLIIANEKALEQDIRYIDVDLNRSFPADENSNKHEDKLAVKISNEIKNDDAILALHSTQSSPSKFTIFSHETEINLKSIKSIPTKYSVYCNELENSTLDSEFKNSITLECGPQYSTEAIKFGYKSAKFFLRIHNALIIDKKPRLKETTIIQAKKIIPKEKGKPKIYYKNFEIIPPNTIFAEDEKYKHKTTDKNYMPILMSEHGYEDIFGLIGKKYKTI